MSRFFAGLDLGQSRDFTALAVTEVAEETGAWDPALFAWRKLRVLHVRYLERMPLGTSYPDVVERVADVLRSPDLAQRCHMAVDGTGVGRPVVDLLRRARLGCTLLPVLVTGGDVEGAGNGYYRIPKRHLITGLQVALQRGALRIAAGMPYCEALVKEMAAMEIRVTAAGNEQFGARREGTHDDLVFALALACWCAQRAGWFRP